MKHRGKQKSARVALLTPYDGGNLGDSAIQEAVIANLRRCDPDIDVCGITLNPATTSARHRIPCYPLAATSLPHYQATREPVSEVSVGHQSLSAETSGGLYRRLRRLTRVFPPAVWLKILLLETLHVVESYRLLRRVDALVVAGGGQIDDEWGGSWGHPYALMKWSVLARAARSSLVFLSVGACRIGSPLTRLFLKIALSLACYRSYRDAESRRLALGITSRADGRIVPDLAFSLPSVSIEPSTRSKSAALRVGVSPIAFGQARLWPTADPVQYEHYVEELACFVKEILRSGSSVTLFSSSPPDDQIFADLQKRLDLAPDSTSSGQLSTSTAGTVAELLDVLHSVDLVVASRLHGVLLSFLVGKPAIAISYDRKVTSLMDELGQAAYCMDIRSLKSDDLIELFSALRTDRDVIQSAVATIFRQYDEVLQEQYRNISQLILGRCPNAFQANLRVASGEKPLADEAEVGWLGVSQATEPPAVPARGRTSN